MNNAASNLRYITSQHNTTRPRPKNLSTNKSGVRGVFFAKADKKWIAAIMLNNKYVYRKSFKTKSEAVRARKREEKIWFKEFT